MVDCPRCGRTVDALHVVTPDVITTELIESVDDSKGDLAGEGEIQLCTECLAELHGK